MTTQIHGFQHDIPNSFESGVYFFFSAKGFFIFINDLRDLFLLLFTEMGKVGSFYYRKRKFLEFLKLLFGIFPFLFYYKSATDGVEGRGGGFSVR